MIQKLRLPLHVAPHFRPHVSFVRTLQVRVGIDLAVERAEPSSRPTVGQADLINRNQMRRHLGVEKGEPSGHLTADRVADDGSLRNAGVLHKPGRVRRV